jgi:LysR family hydrogen peroxide-inducible transcriptional activator
LSVLSDAIKDLNISLKQLRYFLTAAKHKSLRQAAKELKISQPSLSAQIKSLEEALGIELFERTRGGVTPTPLGRELIPETKVALNAAEAIMDAANFATKGPTGTFRLGVSPSLGPYSLPWILPAVRHEFPDVKFFVREDVPSLLVDGLISKDYDLIFSPLPIDDPTITVMPLFREPLFLVVNAKFALAKYEQINASQLAGLDILAIEEHHQFFTLVEGLCHRFDANLLRDYEGSSLDAIRQMVYMEMGGAFLPALYIRSEILDRDELHILSIEDESIYRVHALAWRNTSPLRGFYRKLGKFFQKIIKKEFDETVTLM